MRFVLFILCLSAWAARAAHTQVELLLPTDAKAGDTVLVGVQLKMESGWHTYWKNPGEAGQATEIKWQLPPGVTAGETAWPMPHKIPPPEVVTYGYEDEVVLLAPLKLAANLPAGPLHLQAKVSWLECKESCLPADTEVEATLNLGGAAANGANDQLLADWLAKVPATANNLSPQAYWEKTTTNDSRPLILQWTGKADGAEFFPDASDDFEIQGATEIVPGADGAVQLRKVVKKSSGDWPKAISGVIATGAGGARKGYAVKLSVDDSANRAPASPAAASAAPPAKSTPAQTSSVGRLSETLFGNMLLALLGGIILNLMPCVLPILSLKVLSIVKLSGKDAAIAKRHSLIYTLGVLVSFWIVAGLVIAGRLASWGEQFQDARFIIVITTLMMLIALNLFGVFEFVLPGGATNAAYGLAAREGASGSFFNGVLAVVLGASCVAPVMAGAVGWAMTKTPGVIVLIFTMLGLGLALPYVLLAYLPALRAYMPKPGAWMEKFKIALGFPMLGMAAWTLSLVSDHFGSDGILWTGLFLVLLAAACWIYGEFIQRGSKGKMLAAVCALACVGAGYGYSLEHKLHWRHPAEAAPSPLADQFHQFGAPVQDGKIVWYPWSAEAVTAARQAGRPILVDFTAHWCLTCQVNKASSIEIDSVMKKLTAINAIVMIGDYTKKNPAIRDELARFGVPGVPLVLVYPKDAAKPAQALPAVLTPGIVLDALDQAAK